MNLTENISKQQTCYETRLSAGKHWSFRLRRGLLLRMKDMSGGGNVGMLLYNMHDLLERYNAPDTLKCQHTFYLNQGHCLYSDMGRILASVVHDDVGGHDTVCGSSNRQLVERQYGPRSYQKDRNDWHQNGHDAFLVELSKYGLGRRDVPANINWFSRCSVAEDGSIELAADHSPPGTSVALRIEMDCLVVLHTCPHPLLQATDYLTDYLADYPDTDIAISLEYAEPMSEHDECLNHCAENRRGFQNNQLYHLGA